MRQTAFIYQPELAQHVLREGHVLQPTRLQYTYELLDCYHAFQGASLLVPPRLANDKELLSFHTQEYVEAVKSFSRGETRLNPLRFNFNPCGDNPIFPGMYEASALAVGASLVAAELVAEGQVSVAFNVSGGLHHAAPNSASGFCVFNDAVVAINYLLGRGTRVAYVDIDAHHGDGVQNAFYDSDQVLTISIHETGQYLFPGSGDVGEIGSGAGRGYAANIPLAPYTDDEAYLWAFSEVVPPLVSSFRPDILVTQLGCDTHYMDPLTHLNLTTEGYTQVVKELSKLAPKWLALGGGGYEVGVVARAWTLAYGVMMDREWPNDIPLPYQQKYGLKKLRDEEKSELDASTKRRSRQFAEQTVQELKKAIFPRHGLRPV